MPTGDFGPLADGHDGPVTAAVHLPVVNTGSATVTVTGSVVTGCASGSCVGALAPGASCRVGVTYSPTVAGPLETQALTFVIDGEQVTTYVDQEAMNREPTALDPFLVSPIGLDFGAVPVGARSDPQPVTVTNVSLTPRTVTGTITPPAAGYALTDNCSGVTLAPARTCRMSVRFSPTTAGTATSTATGTWGPTPWSVALTGTGVTGPPAAALRISPTSLDWGFLRSGQSRAQTVTVTNQTAAAVTLTGAVDTHLALARAGTCHDGLVLGAGAACSMTFTFTTGDANYILEDPITGTWSGQRFSIDVAATESGRLLRVGADGLDAGSGTPAGARPTQVVTVMNQGVAPLDLTDAVIDASGRATSPANTCQGTVLPTGGTCQIVVGWRKIVSAPGAEPSQFGYVLLHGPTFPGGGAQITGASAAPSHVLTPAVTFGEVPVGGSRSVAVQVGNVADVDHVVTARVVGALPLHVTATTTCDGPVVPAGGRCAVVVTWHPTDPLEYLSAPFVVRLDGTYPTTVDLRGRAR